jgi:hypothetical protein
MLAYPPEEVISASRDEDLYRDGEGGNCLGIETSSVLISMAYLLVTTIICERLLSNLHS